MSRTLSPSVNHSYGLARTCRLWRVSRATLYRHRRSDPERERRRPGPQGSMSDVVLAGRIRETLTSSPFHGEGYRKDWARLRFSGIRTSPRRVLQVMRDPGLLAHQRSGAARGPRAHDGTITTERVDEMWDEPVRAIGSNEPANDLTTVATGEGAAAVFIAVDHCSAECVGVHASVRATRLAALEPIRQAVRRAFGAFSQGIAAGLKIRHDHGSQYMSRNFQAEVKFFGAESSPAFVRAPEGNGCAEHFIRTLKENLLWIRWFDTVEDLRRALLEFQRTYNETWIVQRHGYRTPAQVRQEQMAETQTAA